MSQFIVILSLIVSLLIAVLAIANNQPVVLNYLLGRAEVSAVLIILGAAILGALAVILPGLVRHIRVTLQFRALRNELKVLKEKMASLEKERTELLTRSGRPEPSTLPEGLDDIARTKDEQER